MSSHNHKHNGITCEQCKTNKHVVMDPFHAETYCQKCGTVIIDNTLPQITLILEQQRTKELFIRNLWKKEP